MATPLAHDFDERGVEDGNVDRPGDICDRQGPRGYYCTRPDDHEGDHAAWASAPDELLDRWKRGR